MAEHSKSRGGINAWVTAGDWLVAVGAGYVAEDMYYSFMPAAFGWAAIPGATFAALFFFFFF